MWRAASLLPRELPSVPGVDIAAAYVAATEGLEVGGDFYDVYQTPGGWGMAIGDVCGKGEEAAAVTASARHAIRVLAHRNADPAEVLRQANEIMLAERFEDRFITACAAQLSWRDDSVHVVLGSAGHPGPAVVQPDGEVRLLDGGGMALGLFPGAEPGIQEIDLRPGDLFFMFTDGVTEARSPEMTYFEERLADKLASLAGRPPTEVCSAMRTLVLEFSLNDLRDDMTMLVLRVGKPPSLPVRLARPVRADHVFRDGNYLLGIDQVGLDVAAVWPEVRQHLRIVRGRPRILQDPGRQRRRVPHHVRRVGVIADLLDDRPVRAAQHDAPAQPARSPRGHEQARHAGQHDDQARDMQIDAGDGRVDSEGRDGADGQQRQPGRGFHDSPIAASSSAACSSGPGSVWLSGRSCGSAVVRSSADVVMITSARPGEAGAPAFCPASAE